MVYFGVNYLVLGLYRPFTCIYIYTEREPLEAASIMTFEGGLFEEDNERMKKVTVVKGPA